MKNLYISVVILIVFILFQFIIKKLKYYLYYLPNTDYFIPKVSKKIEDIFIETDENCRIHAWYYNSNNKSKPTLLICHGNAGNLTYRNTIMENLIYNNISFLIFDYKGFGKSSGKTYVNSTYDDARNCYEYMKNTLKIDNIIPFGESIGCYPASKVALTYQTDKLILLSGPHNISTVVSNIFGKYISKIINLFTAGDIDVGNNLINYNGKTLILHSKDDRIVCYENSKLNEKMCTSSEFIDIKGGHNNPKIEWKDIMKFIS